MTLKYPEKFNMMTLLTTALFAVMVLFSCEYIPIGDAPDSCEISTEANSNMSEVFSLWEGDPVEIQEELIVQAYVISSDQAGNFFNELIVQDDPAMPQNGMRILIQSADIHANYPTGSRVYIHLKGLTLDQIGGEWRLGLPQELFGNILLTGIPHNQISSVLEKDCAYEGGVQARQTTVAELSAMPNLILVRMEQVQFQEEELQKTYADPTEETLRFLEDCTNQNFSLVSSGYAQFQFEPLPGLNGSITAIIERKNQDNTLRIRSLIDIEFQSARCEKNTGEEGGSESVLISEIGDPENDIKARFIELYNGGVEPALLEGWKLRRFTNGNSEFSHEIDLSGQVLEPGKCLVIAADEEGFTQNFGVSPDMVASAGSAANSNGDDNIQLLNAEGVIVDTFGRPGEDGSGTDHEFEDGRALRHPDVKMGAATFNAEFWFLWNDTGNNGTINLPQQAPDDYTPGLHPDPSSKIY